MFRFQVSIFKNYPAALADKTGKIWAQVRVVLQNRPPKVQEVVAAKLAAWHVE